MGDTEDQTSALALLLLWLQKDVVPPLTESDIEAVLDKNKAATYWAPNTAYAIGQRILPPVRNGNWYKVIQPGTSQASSRFFHEWPTMFGARLVDGSSDPQLILENEGSDSIFRANQADPLSVNVYDVIGAARECLKTLRRSKAAQLVDDNDSGVAVLFERWDRLAEQFHPIRFPVRVVRG
jgi:hypothetical protein